MRILAFGLLSILIFFGGNVLSILPRWLFLTDGVQFPSCLCLCLRLSLLVSEL